MLPKALDDLIESLSLLPGVGPRTAERYGKKVYQKQNGKRLMRFLAVMQKIQGGHLKIICLKDGK
jgi:recombinational DNA repair protein RecR